MQSGAVQAQMRVLVVVALRQERAFCYGEGGGRLDEMRPTNNDVSQKSTERPLLLQLQGGTGHWPTGHTQSHPPTPPPHPTPLPPLLCTNCARLRVRKDNDNGNACVEGMGTKKGGRGGRQKLALPIGAEVLSAELRANSDRERPPNTTPCATTQLLSPEHQHHAVTRGGTCA